MRTLESLATIHNITGQLIKEIKVFFVLLLSSLKAQTLELAATIAQDKKTSRQAVALIDAYGRAVDLYKTTENPEDLKSEIFIEHSFKLWFCLSLNSLLMQ